MLVCIFYDDITLCLCLLTHHQSSSLLPTCLHQTFSSKGSMNIMTHHRVKLHRYEMSQCRYNRDFPTLILGLNLGPNPKQKYPLFFQLTTLKLLIIYRYHCEILLVSYHDILFTNLLNLVCNSCSYNKQLFLSECRILNLIFFKFLGACPQTPLASC